jgi:putative nucleotidyltransferase with HDIG domain
MVRNGAAPGSAFEAVANEEVPVSRRPGREEAWAILTENVASEGLRAHALAVEAVMRRMARKRGQDEEEWGTIGLVHDVDYERFPDEHLVHAPEILRTRGWPEDWIRAVLSHGYGMRTDVEPVTDLEKTLFAVDELTGLVAAAALVRPSRSVLDLPVKSVMKKWKDRSFAAGVDRSVIEKGAAMLGVPVEDLVADTIEGMRTVAEAIGLKGHL